MRNSRSIIYLTKDYEAFRAYFSGYEFTDGEDVHFFSDKPALKLGQQFTGTSAETPLTLLFSRLNAVNAAIFPVNAAIFPVKRR